MSDSKTVYFSLDKDLENITIRAGEDVLIIPIETWREINIAILKHLDGTGQLSKHYPGLVEH